MLPPPPGKSFEILPSTKLHGVTFHKTSVFITSAMKTSGSDMSVLVRFEVPTTLFIYVTLMGYEVVLIGDVSMTYQQATSKRL